MDKKQNNVYRIATFSVFFINGGLVATWVSRIPAIQEKMGITEGTLGFVLSGFSIGLIIALILVSEWIARAGSKKVIFLSIFNQQPYIARIDDFFSSNTAIFRPDDIRSIHQRNGYCNERASCSG